MLRTSTHFQTDCHFCALPVIIPPLKHLQTAYCPRCQARLSRFHRHSLDYSIAFAVAAVFFLLASIPFDFLSFRVQGQQENLHLAGTVTRMVDENYLILALIQLVTILLIPVLVLGAMLYLLLPIRMGKPALPGASIVYLLQYRLIPWCMVEVFLIGALVSIFKMSSMADIGLGRSFYAFGLFSFCLLACFYFLDQQQLRMAIGIRNFHAGGHKLSSQHTWALLITAVLFYIPASTYPIMTSRVFGKDVPSTIMEGVFQLWAHGSYPIAIIIFVASVIIPIAKIILIAWLTFTVQRKMDWRPDFRMQLYRLIEFIGRWSMIDVFVVVLLASLIDLGSLLSVYPGPAILAFCTVVILTMLAAITFDSHLIWNPHKHDE